MYADGVDAYGHGEPSVYDRTPTAKCTPTASEATLREAYADGYTPTAAVGVGIRLRLSNLRRRLLAVGV